MGYRIIEGPSNHVQKELNRIKEESKITIHGTSMTSYGPQNDSIGVSVLISIDDFEKTEKIDNTIDNEKMVKNYLFSDQGKEILSELIQIVNPIKDTKKTTKTIKKGKNK